MKHTALLACTIFTALILIFALLSPYGLAPAVNNVIALQGFVMSISIAVLMSIAEKLENRSENFSVLFDTLIKILICYSVVFFEGVLFQMIHFSWRGLLEITPSLIPIFIVTYFLQYFTCYHWANAINESIKRKQ